jgi:Domain of unknown function (DUF202)
MRRPSAPGDPGLAPERTALATQRSAIALAALAALMVRVGVEKGIWLVAGPASALLMAVSIATWSRGRRAYHRRLVGGDAPPRCTDLQFLAAATGLAGIVAFGLALLP